MLPDVVFGCLRQIIPDRVPAEGTSCLWNLIVRGETQRGRRRQLRVLDGGHVATAAPARGFGKDGLSATAYPERRARHAGRDRRDARRR